MIILIFCNLILPKLIFKTFVNSVIILVIRVSFMNQVTWLSYVLRIVNVLVIIHILQLFVLQFFVSLENASLIFNFTNLILKILAFSL